jgi:glycosyltransferase involved in cell wall biosynthesis
MKVVFVASGNFGNSVDNLTKAQGDSLIAAGIEIIYFPIIGKGIKGYLSHISKLKRFLKENKVSIIHAHFGLCGIVGYFAKSNEKLMISFMGDDLIGSVNNEGNYSLQSRFFTVLNKFFAKFIYDFNIVKSQNLKNKLWRSTKAEIIPNGVNFLVFFPIEKKTVRKELGINENVKIVLFAADPLRAEKNFSLAKAAVNATGINDLELKVVHKISQQELNRQYNAADVVLLTSMHEGSPNVIKEAMACNRPIVSTDVGDVNDLISKTEGCFVSSQEVKELADNIVKALAYENTSGRNDILSLRSENIAQKVIGVYNSILNK